MRQLTSLDAEFLAMEDLWGTDPRQAQTKGTAVFSHWYHLTNGTTIWIACLR